MNQTKKTIFTNGCFDLLHVGHFKLLTHCRKLAGHDGEVIVALDSDEKVARDKGALRPIFSFEKRREALHSLGYPVGDRSYVLVSYVVKFNSNTELHDLIKEAKPDIIVKGSDWTDRHVVGSDIAPVNFYKVEPGYSTSEIIKAVLKKSK